jgi:hypothetical protein
LRQGIQVMYTFWRCTVILSVAHVLAAHQAAAFWLARSTLLTPHDDIRHLIQSGKPPDTGRHDDNELFRCLLQAVPLGLTSLAAMARIARHYRGRFTTVVRVIGFFVLPARAVTLGRMYPGLA